MRVGSPHAMVTAAEVASMDDWGGFMSATHALDGRATRPHLTDAGRTVRDDFDLIEQAEQALEVLHGKWKVPLVVIMARGVRRHSRLLDCMPGASKKTMTDTLRALERDGLVVRRVFAEVPVRVEYSLTPLGWSMTEPLVALAVWGEAHSEEVTNARRFAESHVRNSGGLESPAAVMERRHDAGSLLSSRAVPGG
jgi:DNA-binding HxlR family transcriptional regulator